jgi:hypothetical protein
MIQGCFDRVSRIWQRAVPISTMGCQRQARKGAWPLGDMLSPGRISEELRAAYAAAARKGTAQDEPHQLARIAQQSEKTGQALVYINFEDDAGRRTAAGL